MHDGRVSGGMQVAFTLHSSFAQPVRELTAPPYEVHEEGWGEFDVVIKVCCRAPTQEHCTHTSVHYHELLNSTLHLASCMLQICAVITYVDALILCDR
jgi:transcription initiation factor IIF auxiliary subunit